MSDVENSPSASPADDAPSPAALQAPTLRSLQAGRARVIGGGLAGCEAAWQLASAGIDVELMEMKPHKRTPAQVSDHLAELVCSNSFRSNSPTNAVGLLKAEMRRCSSLIMAAAEVAKVPAGDALAVDRERFAQEVEGRLGEHPRVTIRHDEVTTLPRDDVATIVATGPLTADALAQDIATATGQERLAFYDAIAPIIEAESVRVGTGPGEAYFKSRYDKGEGTDYLNCPMTETEFHHFLDVLGKADAVTAKEFEDLKYFEGCLPVEVIASRGPQTLTFGCMKPVGLEVPTTGERPYAVLQLRKEDVHGTAYNLVGCQTRLKQPAQREVFRSIPALSDVKFLRYGAIHRNTYVESPRLLDATLSLSPSGEDLDHVYLAGQITGVEGYVESTACGLFVSWMVIDRLTRGASSLLDAVAPEATMLGGLYRHTRGVLRADAKAKYEPANVMWSMVPPVKMRAKKHVRRERAAQIANDALQGWLNTRQRNGAFVGAPVV